MFFYLWIDGGSNFMQFYYHLIVHQILLNFHVIYNGYNLTVFDGLSNDNEIVWNMNDYQSIDRRTHYKKKFKIFFLYLFKGPLSTDPSHN
jgi:hypothetical protein